ncbi:MAG: hypothetical protein HC861_10490 [Rhodospirillaceae bacterium]|nr:hypothetical protein [Rhodospirillaceae bacterium]
MRGTYDVESGRLDLPSATLVAGQTTVKAGLSFDPDELLSADLDLAVDGKLMNQLLQS